MKPGKARKDRPKGAKTFSRGSNKRVERSAVARPEKRDNRRDDKGDARKGFRKPVKTNDREVKRDDRRGDRPEKRFDRRGSMQDAVAGKNSVVEALRAKIPAKELVVAIKVELDEKISEAIRLAKNADLPIKEIPRRALDDLTGFSNHQGIALVIKPFGADGVVIPERRNAAMTGSAWKASAGAAARMPISQVTNLVRSIEDAKKAGCFVIGLDADGDTTLAKMNLATESVFIVVGSEGKGLSRLVREKCDLVVSIPMQSSVESLNASVATAIVMHQVAAERSK
jgi:23S rRNA (guanosine2251-2'-O)-methyltransferase